MMLRKQRDKNVSQGTLEKRESVQTGRGLSLLSNFAEEVL